MTKPEVVAFLVLLAAAIAFAAPRLMAHSDSGAVFAGACAERAPPQDCTPSALGGSDRLPSVF
jgi:hypothetical protein